MQYERTYEYKISIVTALYNVELYLEEAIESIINQSIGFENIQMILVDDGSDDSSGEICDKYTLEYPNNIFVIHQENRGVSSARNAGLELVKGKYINFMDADDKLASIALETMFDYIEENEKWIDMVSIPFKFFGGKQGDHVLNYKFKKKNIVDLRREYTYIQLSLAASLVKSSCFDNRRFDEELAYTEDAQLIIDILLDKMHYGVLDNTCYFYRKREESTSAVDMSIYNASWYSNTIRHYLLHSLELAKKKKGYLPKFVQYYCIYDLQWRFMQEVPSEVLTKEEKREYFELCQQVVQHIDNDIVSSARNIPENIKTAVLLLKDENKRQKEFEFIKDDLRISFGDKASGTLGSYSSSYEIFKVFNDQVIIEGYIRCFNDVDPIEVILKSLDDTNEAQIAEYHADTFERYERNTFLQEKLVTKGIGFRFRIPVNDARNGLLLQLCIRYKSLDIICKELNYGKFFPIDKRLEHSYFYDNNILLRHQSNLLILEKAENIKGFERKILCEIFRKKGKKFKRGFGARTLYNVFKHFKHKEIWLISDRLDKADDNGEAFFDYINNVNPQKDIITYFVTEKSNSDYDRIKQIGKTVSFYSFKYKMLSLLCDKIVSSQANEYTYNRFFDMKYLYKDILAKQKFVFLQHGVTKDNVSKWLNKYNQNISILVTATNDEYESMLLPEYYYGNGEISLTGFPRYDYLEDTSVQNKIITFMPTWRKYLTSGLDIQTGERRLIGNFQDSSYYQMYHGVFHNKKLMKAAKTYGYTLKIMLHPSMPLECLELLDLDPCIEVLPKSTRYRYIFAESNLVITDYSSTVFDFAYLRKPVLYYQYDKDEFFSGKHTFTKGYFEYERDGFGEVLYDEETLVDKIVDYMENGCQLKEEYQKRIDKTFPFADHSNCERVFEKIKSL